VPLNFESKLAEIEITEPKYQRISNKNLAIAIRPRVNCAHNTLRAFIGLNITLWPWNLV